jgi:anti-sigma regulatory factor (Ser/Thr protein kinase)/anti-anti-sigma regulatory factor
MKISQKESDLDKRILLLYFEGELNASDCEATSQVFQGIIDSGKFFIMAILDHVTFISSPFLGELMGCKLRLTEKGGDLVLVGLPFNQREKLVQMGADRIFRFFQDTHSAYRNWQWDHGDAIQTIRVEMPPTLSAVPAVRRFASGIARQKGYSSRDAFRIETIVDEIANNAIEHGEAGQGGIVIQFKIDRHRIELEVQNKTRLDKAEHLRKLLNEAAEEKGGFGQRGRGIALVKLISQSIDVSIDSAGTKVSVTKMREDA